MVLNNNLELQTNTNILKNFLSMSPKISSVAYLSSQLSSYLNSLLTFEN
jgi:hypothetical protein